MKRSKQENLNIARAYLSGYRKGKAGGQRDYRRPFTGEKLDTSNIEALEQEAKNNGGQWRTAGGEGYSGVG
jgi:hypothetical protein